MSVAQLGRLLLPARSTALTQNASLARVRDARQSTYRREPSTRMNGELTVARVRPALRTVAVTRTTPLLSDERNHIRTAEPARPVLGIASTCGALVSVAGAGVGGVRGATTIVAVAWAVAPRSSVTTSSTV